MAGRAHAVANGDELARAVAQLGSELGLEALEQVRVARRIWGAVRLIDVVLVDPTSRKTLGIECKYQGTTGTAEEKIPATIQDIAAWPIPGLVVFAGDGFTANMRSFLISTGKAVEFEELRPWLCLFFGLPLTSSAPRAATLSLNRPTPFSTQARGRQRSNPGPSPDPAQPVAPPVAQPLAPVGPEALITTTTSATAPPPGSAGNPPPQMF